MDTPVLAVRHVSKSFGRRARPWSTSTSTSHPEKSCLAGENGSGKSTLIKVISESTPPNRAWSPSGPRVYATDTRRRHRRGCTRHLPGLLHLPNLSVMENIAFGSEVAAGRRLVNRFAHIEVAHEAMPRSASRSTSTNSSATSPSPTNSSSPSAARSWATRNSSSWTSPRPPSPRRKCAPSLTSSPTCNHAASQSSSCPHKLEEVFEIANASPS